jgi:regulator of protease activity HflC (stomatin/prohibitin superfamily)
MLPVIAAGLALVMLVLSTRYVPAGHAGLIERSGVYRRTLRRRVGWVVPLVEHLRLVELRPHELVLGAEPFRSVDEVQLLATVQLRFQALDPVRATYEVEDLRRGIEHLAVHELREIIGGATGGEVLRSGAAVSTELQTRMQRLEGAWGVLIDDVQVELRLFLQPPRQRNPHLRHLDVPA